ncbi:MAG: hypothetical protein RMI90_02845 [Thermoguttaceae bacterium]|nr:hypothetical protein [Thermoguttaceae bacterium]
MGKKLSHRLDSHQTSRYDDTNLPVKENLPETDGQLDKRLEIDFCHFGFLPKGKDLTSWNY